MGYLKIDLSELCYPHHCVDCTWLNACLMLAWSIDCASRPADFGSQEVDSTAVFELHPPCCLVQQSERANSSSSTWWVEYICCKLLLKGTQEMQVASSDWLVIISDDECYCCVKCDDKARTKGGMGDQGQIDVCPLALCIFHWHH